eukprot:SAG11_NODE_16590_length_543_cov_1.306306_1_plen_46_part_00
MVLLVALNTAVATCESALLLDITAYGGYLQEELTQKIPVREYQVP